VYLRKHAQGEPDVDVRAVQALCDNVRLAARLVDMPPNELHTDALVDEAVKVAKAVGATVTIIRVC
jgi:leucyl aminopeptidase